MAQLQSTSISGTLSATGAVTLSNYGAGFVRLNSSGAIVMDTNTYVTGGPYLPTAGGTLTGDLRFSQGAGFGRIAFTDNYHGMILRGFPSDAAGNVTVTDVTSLIQHSGDFRFYRTNGSINELYFQVNATAPYWRGNVMLHAGNYGSYALASDTDSEQQVGLRYLNWNDGVRRMNTDPRWNESGYDADLGCLHIWAWTAGGVAYGRAGIALYNGSAYQYLTTKSGQTNIYVNNNAIWHAGNLTNLNQLTNGPGYVTGGPYLPLSGGTMSGNVQFNSNLLQFNNSGVRSWNIGISGGNLNIYSGDGSGSLHYNGRPIRDSYYRTFSGFSDYYSGGTGGWYRVAEITLTSNCSGAVIYGTVYDNRYDGADTYQVAVVARADCGFSSDNEAHYINVGCTILGSTNFANYRDKIRVVLSASSSGSRTYELQFYETPWNHDTWQIESNGWTVYASPQAPRTAVGTPRVNYISKQNADNYFANTAVYSPIFYDSANSSYYLDLNSTTSIRTVGSWRSDSGAWDGEFSGKIQYHSNHWYFQAADLWIFRNAGGGNVFTVNQSGNGTFSGTISASNISSGVNASHIVQRDANGYIYANHVNFNTTESENPTISSFITSNGDGWSRKSSLQHVRNQLGNYGGWITGYTETDTLATVTGRGATTGTAIVMSGGSGTTPTLSLDRNIASPSNYYNGLQLEVKATSGTAGIGLHRSGYSHVGIYHDTTNVLSFNMNSGTVTLNHNTGTIWGTGNLTNLNQLSNGPGYITASYGGFATRQDGTRYSTNFNSILSSGFFNAEAQPANAPNSYGQLIVAKGADTGLQIAGGYSSQQLWFRGWGYGPEADGFWPWRRLLNNGADPYAADMNQYVKTTSSPTFSSNLYISADGSSGYVASRIWLYSHNNYRGAGIYLSGTGSTWFAGTGYTDFDGTYIISRRSVAGDDSTAWNSYRLWQVNSGGATYQTGALTAEGSITTNGYLYTNYSTRIGEIWGYGGVYRSSGEMMFGTEGSGWRFHSANSQKAIIGTDGNIWMAWANDWISNLLAAKQNASTAITTSNIGSQSVSYASSAGNATNAVYLGTHDLRSIAPNSHDAYKLRFGFTSWANNNTAPWADYLHLRSYSDSSGGSDNLVMFLKSGIGMRIWQQSFGSGSTYSSYVDVLHSSNYNSYSPTLTGGGASGTWGISITGNAASASSVAWGNVSSKPASWLNNTNLIEDRAPSETAFPSGFYQNSGGGAGNPVGTWFNFINVRHSNPGNGHGYQIGMSYYDNNLWFRSYQGGTSPSFASWSRALGTNTDPYPSNMNQYVRTTDAVTFGGATINYSGSNVTAIGVTHTGSISSGQIAHGLALGWTGYGASFAIVYKQGELSPSDMCHIYNVGGFYMKIFNGSGNNFHRFDDNGSVSINSSSQGSYTFNVTGDIYATADVIAFSDARVKEDVRTVENALDKVTKLRGVTYIKKDEENKKRKMGVIAQEVLEVLPEVVHEDNDGYYGVSYGNIVGVLIEAIKEQQKQIDELKQELKNK